MFDLSNKVFVVTGGAGYLGSAICGALADQGATVLSLSSRLLHREDRPKHPTGNIQSQICDLSRAIEVRDLLGKFATVHHGLDGLVHCAGRSTRGINLETAPEEFADGIEGMLRPFLNTVQTALGGMKDAGGSIVTIGSMWGRVSPEPRIYLDLKNEPSLSAVAAAGAMASLMRYLAVLAAPKGIRVNAVVPGWCPKPRGAERPDYMAQITRRVPAGRIGRPADIVGAVAYLLSSASSYLTGQQLVVDGGYTVQ